MDKQNSDTFLTFFNNYNSMMLLIDTDSGKIINANQAALNYYGYSLETITGMSVKEINTLSEDQINIEFQNILKEERNHFNFQHRIANGELRNVEVYSSPIEYQGKTVLLSIIYDTTNRNKEFIALQNDLDSTLAAIPDLMFELGLDGLYYSIRSNRTDLMAAPPKNMLGKTIFDILPIEAANICSEALQEANVNGLCEGKQISLILNGTQKWFELSVALKANIYIDGPHFIVLSRDITSRKKIEIEMKDSQDRFKALHDAASGGIVIHEKGIILECNLRLSKLFGYRYDELINMNGLLLIAEKSLDTVTNNIMNAYEKPYEAFGKHKDGTEFPVRIESREIIYKGKKTRVTEFNDITQERKAQEQLRYMANYDSLTNLPNRSLFADRLRQAIAQAKRRVTYLAVVYIDLDGFKEINDTYGHSLGDKLLICISKQMQLALREEDTIARFGGDEFLAIIANLKTPKDCLISLERLLNAASSILEIGDLKLRVSASLGVAIFPKDVKDIEDIDILISRADQAMYKAKQNGKNQYYLFDEDYIQE